MEGGRKLWEYYLHKKDKELYAEPVNINASFYDIRAYFQGFENGKMRNKSDDEKYNELLRDLRTYQKVLAKQIEKKVYLYGFLKGEAEVDPAERLHELERQNEELRHQLHEKAVQGAAVINFIGGNVTYNDNSNNYTIKKITFRLHILGKYSTFAPKLKFLIWQTTSGLGKSRKRHGKVWAYTMSR